MVGVPALLARDRPKLFDLSANRSRILSERATLTYERIAMLTESQLDTLRRRNATIARRYRARVRRLFDAERAIVIARLDRLISRTLIRRAPGDTRSFVVGARWSKIQRDRLRALVHELRREVREFRVATYKSTRAAHGLKATVDGATKARASLVDGRDLESWLKGFGVLLSEDIAAGIVIGANDAASITAARRIAAHEVREKFRVRMSQVSAVLISPSGEPARIAITE